LAFYFHILSGTDIHHHALKFCEVLSLCGDRVERISSFLISVLFNSKRSLDWGK